MFSARTNTKKSRLFFKRKDANQRLKLMKCYNKTLQETQRDMETTCIVFFLYCGFLNFFFFLILYELMSLNKQPKKKKISESCNRMLLYSKVYIWESTDT